MNRLFLVSVLFCLMLVQQSVASEQGVSSSATPQKTMENTTSGQSAVLSPSAQSVAITSNNTESTGAQNKKSNVETFTCSASPIVGKSVMVLMAFFYTFAFMAVRRRIASEGWKLSEALSEGYTPSASAAPAVGAGAGADAGAAGGGAPAPVQLIASSSRFIAFIGSIVLVGLFVASSFYIVWALFTCQPLNRLNDLGTYLISGSALFAPYAVNKLSEIFKAK